MKPLILGLLLAAVPAFSRHAANEPRIMVRLLDYVNLPNTARTDIAFTVTHVLGQAGLRVDFVECFSRGMRTGAPACTPRLGPAEIVLRILQPKFAVKGEQLGYAAMTPEGGAYVTVFIDPARRRARIDSLSDGVFLGYAVAHEIGHLLLGANAHSSSGIMRPVWRPCDEEWMAKHALVFGTAQARQMRSTLLARLGQ